MATGSFAFLSSSLVAQTPAPAVISPGTGTNASTVNGGPGTVGIGLPSPGAPGQVLTLPGVVARVLGNNSGLLLARQRLQRAQESINQVNAQIKPQFRANANDVYNSYPAFPSTLPAPVISNPTLPDGGVIPAVTDQANSFSTAYIGGNGLNVGGGGNVAPGFVSGTTGASTSSSGGGTATPSTGAGSGGAASPSAATGAASPGTTGNGTTAPNGSTGAEGPSNTGTGNTGTGGGTAAPGTGTAAPAAGGGTAPATGGTGGAAPAAGTAGAGNTGASAGGNAGAGNSPNTAGAAAGGTAPATGRGTTGTGTTGTSNTGGTNAAPGNTGGNGTTGTGNTGTGNAGAGNAGAGNTGTGNTGNGTPAAPQAGAGTATPGTTLTPDDKKKKKKPTPPPAGASTNAGGTGTGMALYAIPAIIQDYVTDTRSLIVPPSPAAIPMTVKIEDAQARARESQEAAEAASSPDAKEEPHATTTGDDSPTGMTAVRGERDTYNVDGNVTQFVDVFGLVPTTRRAESDVRDFYSLDVTRLLNETALAAKNLFFNVLYAGALVATQQEQVDYAAENVRITQSRLRNGIVSRYDVLTAQAALATAQQQLTAAQDQYQLAQAELSYILGTDPDQPNTLQAPALPPLDLGVDVPQDIQIAERQRPEIGQAGRNVDDAQRQVKLAASGLYPVLGLVGAGNYTSNGSTVTPRSYATVSAQVAVPLDDGGLTRSRVRSAQVQVQTEAVTQGQLQSSVSLEVRQAAINIRNAQAEVGSSQFSVTQSLEAVRLAQERYGAGLGTFLDVLNALALLANARTNYANAQYFYQSSLAQLVRAIGGR